RHAAGGPRPGDHGVADGDGDLARLAGGSAPQIAGGGLWAGRDALGDHPGRHPADRLAGGLGGDHSGLRPSSGRDDGPGDAGRQHTPDGVVAVFARRHARRPFGPEVSRGVPGGGGRANVRGPRAAGHHPADQRARRPHRQPHLRQAHRSPQMSSIPANPAATEIDLPRLEKSLRSPRTLFSAVMSCLTGFLTLLAMIPLFSVLIMLLVRGGERLSVALFTELPPAARMSGGGIGNAILGSLQIVAIAALISVPIGILAAIYLAEFGPESKTAAAVRFVAKLL